MGSSKSLRRPLIVGIVLLVVLSMGPTSSATARADEVPGPAGTFPQKRSVDGYAFLIHAPQIRNWPEFERFTASMAFALTPPGAKQETYGTATVTGGTVVDMTRRIVTVQSPEVSAVKFMDPEAVKYEAVVKKVVTRDTLEVPVDLFVSYLADDVLAGDPPAGFNTAPPPIVVRSKPTLLLFVNGKSVSAPLAETGLEVIVNANWPTFRDPSGKGTYYLLARDQWLTSTRLDTGWRAASSLPDGFTTLPAEPEFEVIRQAVPLKQPERAIPDVIHAERPTELIITEGPPALEAISGTDGLQWVKNTESPLFKQGADWYFLVAGRWFKTQNLDAGPWTLAAKLPDAFGEIPADHARSEVRASVPGTVEARMAALEASIPRRTTVRKGSAPPIEITYAESPRFEAIPGTQVARATNSAYDVLRYQNRFYLCYAAAWYVSDAPTGPWSATADVPAAIYSIPPSSPSYAVTDVKATSTSDDEVEYSSTAAYATGMFVGFGIAYWGTGWYYPPYIYGPYYYPYWGSYGHGSWYNPNTGRYGSRSVWLGPYGGYSYTQGYNPTTGRYGYVETAWDGDEWGSFGQTYNPRTGIGTTTERYYDEDSGRLETQRTAERGDEWVRTERTTDFDDGTSTVERETSRGGSSEVQRSADGGSVTSEREITTGSGQRYTVSGEQSRGQGSSTITGSEGSITTETQRSEGRSVTNIEGSGGGQAVSVSGQGPGRTTVGVSGSGDMYAGHDGNVYKKTDDGWQQYQSGQWSNVDRSSDSSRDVSMDSRLQEQLRSDQARSARSNSHSSQLERDYSARQRGNQQFQQRSMNMRRGGGISRRR